MINKIFRSLKSEGIKGVAKRTRKYIKKNVRISKKRKSVYKDILFVSGCNEDLPHPWRYRVVHQREQLESFSYSTDEVYYKDLDLEQARNYRMFVFFRCPYTEIIGKFIKIAKQMNKKVIFDIDDLVIDTNYTNMIEYVREMKIDDKKAYDSNVLNMQKTLKLCDYALVSTNCLALELEKYVPKVYVNRNTASEEMLELCNRELNTKKPIGKTIKIGYFSGSITHNEDFKLVCPAILNIMNRYHNVELYVIGDLDIPNILKRFSDRIYQKPYMDWRNLPQIMAQMDINIAPLVDTIFNRAKSENKWVEAALVRVVTVASNLGAFQDCIQNNVTGILCDDIEEWESALEKLIVDKKYRDKISQAAYEYCLNECTTLNCAPNLINIIEKEAQNCIAFVLPGLELSGGIKVVLRHASILQKNGKEVVILTLEGEDKWCSFEEYTFPVFNVSESAVSARIDCLVATMWTTMPFVETYYRAEHKKYLVQNYERDFYAAGNPYRIAANRTYYPISKIEFITISKWCLSWLEKRYNRKVSYVPNGLEIEKFPAHVRCIKNKIRILIEGDCAVDYKNVDEAFRITNDLDRERFEVWYMSYNGVPKKWYIYEQFLHKVPFEKVGEVYAKCDILLKTSLLESFSYPPLEMMATGGFVIAIPNGGNKEYLKDNYNCLFYESGNIEQAKSLINRLIVDDQLQERLYRNGRKTAELRSWNTLENEILCLYSVSS